MSSRSYVLTFVLSFACVLCAISQTDSAVAQESSGTPEATTVSLLFVQQATGGTLAPTDADTWTLTLTGVVSHTVYFADRPAREAGTVPTAEFVAVTDLFDPDNPPNAALVLAEPESEEEDVLVVELREPVYDAEAETLQYSVTLLEEIGSEGIVEWNERADAALPETFGPVALFIDAFDPTCVLFVLC